MIRLGLVDYGIGNTFSVLHAFGSLGADIQLAEDAQTLNACDGIILPGQGAFKAGMHGLEVRNMKDVLYAAAKDGMPILGICLGMQLFFTKGYEFGECAGLGLLEGSVERLDEGREDCTLPHIGWNSIREEKSTGWQGTILDVIPTGSDMYFAHSYVCKPADPSCIIATTEYEGIAFASVIEHGSLIGCQFHPEKSGETGLKILTHFLRKVEASKAVRKR